MLNFIFSQACSGQPMLGILRVAETRGPFLGGLIKGNPTAWGFTVGAPCFRKLPFWVVWGSKFAAYP